MECLRLCGCCLLNWMLLLLLLFRSCCLPFLVSCIAVVSYNNKTTPLCGGGRLPLSSCSIKYAVVKWISFSSCRYRCSRCFGGRMLLTHSSRHLRFWKRGSCKGADNVFKFNELGLLRLKKWQIIICITRVVHGSPSLSRHAAGRRYLCRWPRPWL